MKKLAAIIVAAFGISCVGNDQEEFHYKGQIGSEQVHFYESEGHNFLEVHKQYFKVR